MWMQVVYLCEVFATLACIHSIYGEKVRWNIRPIVFCMSLMVIYEVANNIQNGGIFSLVAYIPIFLYCKRTFGKSVLQTLAKIVWMVIILTAIEFLCLLIIANFITENVSSRYVVTSLLVLVISLMVLPKINISKVQLRSRPARTFLGIALLIAFLLVLEGKIMRRVNMSLFFFIIPALLMILYLLVKWVTSQAEVDIMKREISVANKMNEKYGELVDDIRVKQHGFKNHITAILSSHYTYKTYERLVEVQDRYCDILMHENRFSNLLKINDKVLVGFLYDKFMEIEADGIDIKYSIYSSVDSYTISSYYLIEILGVLLDNAVEYIKECEEKKLLLVIKENENKYVLSVSNISKYVPYEEIENWFQKGVSSKGMNRGLGLYHVKKLCQELGCDISCRNIDYENNNWIEFSVGIRKADGL